MKLNMGCGHNRRDGYVNVDMTEICKPDLAFNLETTPWPWDNDTAEEVLFNHSLEHLGGDPNVFLAIMKELYRICKRDAVIKINVPHPRHDNFIGDPTHVRIISPQVLSLFDKELNDHWKRGGFSNTTLGHYLDVDFSITEQETIFAEPYASQLRNGAISRQELDVALREKNNVATEYRIKLRVRKAA